MPKTLVSRFDKALISKLPQVQFGGRIEEVRSEREAEKAVNYLLRQPILGFDTETRPSFAKGKSYKVALLQVSSREVCFLFRLNMTDLCPSVLRLLTDTSVTKVGLSWHDDLNSLHKRAAFECAPFVELQQLCRELGIMDMSLQKLYANVFGQRISKSQQLSNWEAENLSQSQKLYAATDAWACLMLYEEFVRLKQTGDYSIEVIPEPEPAVKEPKAEEKPKKERKPRRKSAPKARKKTTRKITKAKNNVHESVS